MPQLKLQQFVTTNSVRFPCVLGQADQDSLKLLIDAEALRAVSKDYERFLSLLIKSAENEKVPISLRK